MLIYYQLSYWNVNASMSDNKKRTWIWVTCRFFFSHENDNEIYDGSPSYAWLLTWPNWIQIFLLQKFSFSYVRTWRFCPKPYFQDFYQSANNQYLLLWNFQIWLTVFWLVHTTAVISSYSDSPYTEMHCDMLEVEESCWKYSNFLDLMKFTVQLFHFCWLAIYHLISNARSWNSCNNYMER